MGSKKTSDGTPSKETLKTTQDAIDAAIKDLESVEEGVRFVDISGDEASATNTLSSDKIEEWLRKKHFSFFVILKQQGKQTLTGAVLGHIPTIEERVTMGNLSAHLLGGNRRESVDDITLIIADHLPVCRICIDGKPDWLSIDEEGYDVAGVVAVGAEINRRINRFQGSVFSFLG